MSDRHLLLVVGVGRSGTSLLTGILGQLGFHVPRPEVVADDTNPRGFSEPRWVVDFHTKLLNRTKVTVNDARPAAFAITHALREDAMLRAELRAWLQEQLEESPKVVVKDPRTSWFLPLWEAVAEELGAPMSFVTMLRHPTEVIASARVSYGDWQPEVSRAAAWVNVTLQTELATRGARRAFVRHDDLLGDWRRELARVETRLGLPVVSTATEAQHAAVDAFVDPGLHRNRGRWEDREVSPPVRDLAEDVWQRVQPLAGEEQETKGLHSSLDEARATFDAFYAEAEALVHTSLYAARRVGGKGRNRKPKPPPPSLKVKLAGKVPGRYRRRVRRLTQSLARRR
jgi:hypothetical protein